MHCVCAIHSEKPSCVKEVSEILDVNATRMSKILATLERKGFITRTIDMSDHRKEQITLTALGVKMAERILSICTQIGNKMWGGWPPEVMSDISRLLQTVDSQ